MKVTKLGEGNYITRSGLPVSIYDIDETTVRPIRGAYFVNKKWHHVNWSEDGTFSDTFNSDLNLTPVVPLPESENGYKIDLSEASKEERREAQELAFELGWEWFNGKEISFLQMPYYFLEDNFKLTYTPKDNQAYFNENKQFQITLSDLRAAVAYKKGQEGKAEQPEPKEERPVNCGIPYTNDSERKAAIKQAESYGYPVWDKNEENREPEDDCIFLDEDGFWFDCDLSCSHIIPLDRSFMEEEIPESFTFPTSDYTKTENEDGTITLTPIDKELEAAKAFLQEQECSEIDLEQIARLMVQFKNS